ncbi:hypothetical protein T01_9320 [Trichinella spiralis]|uniref:Uncharacterized protein n=1 Tax=Trichinella spiralis TaxID=6334 RepID=A0A0V1AMV7_TRISP|nr:hypothetical protein T01_9320 [Trichinella spiralis]
MGVQPAPIVCVELELSTIWNSEFRFRSILSFTHLQIEECFDT